MPHRITHFRPAHAMLCGSTHALVAQTRALLSRIRSQLEVSRMRIEHSKRLCRCLLGLRPESDNEGAQRKEGRE
jgi:hypothetical protein